jgi:fatty-acyl-CoA synthase
MLPTVDKSMHAADLLSKRAELTPDRVALVEAATGCRFTYAELNARACRLANFLRDRLGVAPGDRVSILARNSVVFLDLLYGLPKIGAIFAPFNWRLTAHELAYMVDDLAPTVLLYEAEFAPVVMELAAAAPSLRLLALDGATLATLAAAPADEPLRPHMDLETPYCILYTSGTTGHPKGAIIPHRQVLFNAINTVISWGLTERDVSPIFTPLFHAGGLFAFLTPIHYAGGRIVLARDFDPAATLRTITGERCTVILGVPTLFQMWLECGEFAAADFRHVHFFINGGAACPPQLIQAWREPQRRCLSPGLRADRGGRQLLQRDGRGCGAQARLGGQADLSQRDAHRRPGDRTRCGRRRDRRTADQGPHVTSGYWRKPEATAAALRAGWFHTGDMAHRDADGFYFIDGRYKDMIKSGGENVYAAEVEAVFRQHPAVKDAALIGKPDKTWGEVGVLIVVCAEGAAVDGDTLRTFGGERLARYKLPKEIHFAASLPYSPYGKVEKAKLRELYA